MSNLISEKIKDINVTYYKNESKIFHSVIIFIPGGPGLSSEYFKKFLTHARSVLEADLALIDLPNHNKSNVIYDINFDQASELIINCINLIKTKYDNCIIFAHSLGGCLIVNKLDLLSKDAKIILCDVPYEFNNSKRFQEKREELRALEVSKNFKDIFNLIAPLYFFDSNLFNSDDFWSEGEFLDKGQLIMKGILPIKQNIIKFKDFNNIVFIQGNDDIVLVENNIDNFLALNPNFKYFCLKNAGHFPFIEDMSSVISIIKQYLS